MSLIHIKSEDEYHNLIESPKLTVLFFTADEVEQCKHVTEILADASKRYHGKFQFAKITAENFPNIASNHQVEAVPTVIFLRNGELIDRVDGVNIRSMLEKCDAFSKELDTAEKSLEKRLEALINTAPLMAFIKGDRETPCCGFTKQLITILNDIGIPYETFDILRDEDVRQGLKKYSNWPTYPQVYVKGQLIGGIDIIKELQQANELEAVLKGD